MFLKYHVHNGSVRVGNSEMDYISFGNGNRNLIMLPGLGDGLSTVKGMALVFAIMYRIYAKEFTVYVFSRKNHLQEGCTTREMAKLCSEDNIAMTPYSALAGGRLARLPGESSKRLQEDSYARMKYDSTAGQDGVIIDRVAELAAQKGVSMTEVSLAWLLTKVTSPVVGATKLHHIEGAVKATELELSAEELFYLEELYAPHNLVGVMAQNTRDSAKESHVWSTGNQKI